ncbi:AsmA-like C-terminal domain-containing protein [Planctomycetota bacterium]
MIFRKLFVFLLMILVTLCLAGFNVLVLSASSQIEQRLRNDLAEIFEAEVEIGNIFFDIHEGLLVRDLVLRAPGGGDTLLYIQEASFKHKISSLAIGSLSMKSIDINGSVYVRCSQGGLQWLRVIRKRFLDPRDKFARPLLLRFDEFRSRFKVYVQDDLVFKDNRIQTFTSEINVRRNPEDRRRHLVSGFLNNSFWGDWNVEGELDFHRDHFSRLRITNPKFPLDYQVKEQFVRRVQVMWENFKPRGMASISGRARMKLNDIARTLDYQLEIHLDGGEMVYYNFPYPVQNITGNVIVDGSGLKYRGITGTNGDMRFQINGDIYGFGRAAGVDLVIDAANLKMDEQFYLALNENTRKVYDACEPRGRIDCKIYLKRERGKNTPIPPHFNVLLKDASFKVKFFPYPIEHVSGVMKIRPHYVLIDSIVSQQNGALVEIYDTGIWAENPKQLGCNLKVRGENIPVDDVFLGAIKDEYRDIFLKFQPNGRINLEALFSKKADEEKPDYIVRVSPTVFDFTSEYFPYKFDCTSGTMEFTPGRTLLTDLRGFHGDTALSLDGQILSGKTSSVTVDIDIEFQKLLWNQEFLGALSPKLRAGMEKIKVTKPLNLAINVTYTKSPQGESKAEYQGLFDLDGNDIDFGLKFKDVKGELSFSGKRFADDDFFMIGNGRFQELSVFNKKLNDMNLEYQYWKNTLKVSKIKGVNYGGSIEAELKMILAKNREKEQTKYYGKLKIKDMDTRLFNEKIYQKNKEGRINGHVNFEGITGKPETITGSGEIKMDDVKLWDVPLLSSLLNLLTLQDVEDTNFKTADLYFDIKDKQYVFSEMDFNSPSIDFVGDGNINFSGELDLDVNISIVPGLVSELPGIGKLLQGLVNGVMRAVITASVKGTLDKPKVSLKPLPVITELFKGLFGGRASKQRKEREREREKDGENAANKDQNE